MTNKDLSEKEIDAQENLNDNRFKLLKPLLNWNDFYETRPKQSLIDLMHWAKNTFGGQLSSKEDLNCYIHNKIVIDGSFLQFAEENNINIQCLYKDSVASWNTDHNNEHFMVQGVFKITVDDFEFLHCALFLIGNQMESEVSFMCIVSDKYFRQYIEFRNKFDKWLIDRDRNHMEIHVVGGNGIPYKRDSSWDDLFLPDVLKADIKNSVEGFLNAKKIYETAKVPWKRGMLLYGEPGLGKSSCLRTIISNGPWKAVTVQCGSNTTDDSVTEAFEYAQLQEPGLLYIEDLDSLLNTTVSLSHFLNLLDGVSSKNGILVICTANDLNKLQDSIVDRPSRFDRKWEFPLPDEDMTLKYLKKWFGTVLKPFEYKKIVKQTVESKFSYAYLKELYLSSVFNALADDRELPNIKDINLATIQMLRDKEIVKNGFELSSNKEIGIN